MRRILSAILAILLLASGCVQGATTFIEGQGYVPESGSMLEQSASPLLPTPNTPSAAPQAPAPRTPVPGTPAPGTPVPATPVPGTPAPATPTPQPAGPDAQVGEAEEPERGARLYLDEQPGFDAAPEYIFQNGVLSESDMKLLCLLLNLRQWESLRAVFGMFEVLLEPDIRLCDFSAGGIYAPSLEISMEPVVQEELGLAYITLRHTDSGAENASEYFVLFAKTSAGYTPKCVIRLSLAQDYSSANDFRGNEYGFEEFAGQIFFTSTSQQSTDDGREIRERWYDVNTGALKLDFIYQGEHIREYAGGILQEKYVVGIDRESAAQTPYGFTMQAAGEVLHQYDGMQGSPTPISLMSGEEFTLYYNAKEQRFYTDIDRQLFFADTGRVRPGQYKYVFGEQLTQVLQAARHPNEMAWAEELLLMEDWQPRVSPSGEQVSFDYVGREALGLTYIPFAAGADASRRRLVKSGIEKIAEDIRGMRQDSLVEALEAYGIHYADSYLYELGEEEARFDIRWGDVEDVSCAVNYDAGRERVVLLEIRYTEKRTEKALLIAFRLAGAGWEPRGMLLYTPESGQAGEWRFQEKESALWYSYQAGIYNKQPLMYTLVLYDGRLGEAFVSSYTGKDGTRYAIDRQSVQANTGLTESYLITATLRDEEAPVVAYELRVWRSADGGFVTDSPDPALLLTGQVEQHEGFAAAMEAALAARKTAQQEQPGESGDEAPEEDRDSPRKPDEGQPKEEGDAEAGEGA